MIKMCRKETLNSWPDNLNEVQGVGTRGRVKNGRLISLKSLISPRQLTHPRCESTRYRYRPTGERGVRLTPRGMNVFKINCRAPGHLHIPELKKCAIFRRLN